MRIQNLAFRDDTVLSAEDMNNEDMDNMDSEYGMDSGDGNGDTNTGFEPQFGTLEADEIELTGSNGLVFAGDGSVK